MPHDKYQLHPDHYRLIRNKRKELRISAENLSEQIGKAKSWLSQLERGVFATVKREDLLRLLRVLYASPIDQDEELLLRQFFNDVSNSYATQTKEDIDCSGLLDLVDYESMDLNSEFNAALDHLTKTIQSSFFHTTDKKRKFSILQAIRIQDKNLHHSVILTNRLNSVPLFTLSNHNSETNDARIIEQIEDLNSSLLSDIDSRIAFFNLYNVSWLNNIVNSTVNAVKEAIYVLLELLSPDADTHALREKYNSLIEEINLNCKTQCLSDIKLHSIGNTKIQHLDLTGKYLSNLQKLLQELTEIQIKVN